MKNYTKFASLASVLAIASCASIIEGSTDRVEVTTVPQVNGAMCTMENSRGTSSLVTPGSAVIKKSKTDLKINCKDQASGATGTKTVESGMEGWFLGNIIFGGIIGGGVDAATGSMWEYPKDVSVNMVGAPQVQPQYTPMPAAQPMYAPMQQQPQYAPAPQPMYAPAPQPQPQLAPVPHASLEQQYAPAAGNAPAQIQVSQPLVAPVAAPALVAQPAPAAPIPYFVQATPAPAVNSQILVNTTTPALVADSERVQQPTAPQTPTQPQYAIPQIPEYAPAQNVAAAPQAQPQQRPLRQTASAYEQQYAPAAGGLPNYTGATTTVTVPNTYPYNAGYSGAIAR